MLNLTCKINKKLIFDSTPDNGHAITWWDGHMNTNDGAIWLKRTTTKGKINKRKKINNTWKFFRNLGILDIFNFLRECCFVSITFFFFCFNGCLTKQQNSFIHIRMFTLECLHLNHISLNHFNLNINRWSCLYWWTLF